MQNVHYLICIITSHANSYLTGDSQREATQE